MKEIKKGIVFSDDIKRILNGINAFDYNYSFIPNISVINTLRENFKTDVNKIFNNRVTIITEEEMLLVNNLISGSIPIVTLDKIFISPNEKEIFFLDCTRISGTNKIIARGNELLDLQIMRLSKTLGNKEILLADDVVFSGNVLKNIIENFCKLNIQVVGIITSVCTNASYNYFNSALKYGIKSNYIMSDDVIDQICERDFYFGIAGSGIMVETKNGLYKAPYFRPYGNPCERASIPREYETQFSIECLDRSIYLWEEIDKLKKEATRIQELPERIIYTNANDEVVKTLRLERGKLCKRYK